VDGFADKGFEGGLVDFFVFVDVDGAADVAFEAGVEKFGGIFERGAFGEGEFYGGFVGFSGADDAGVGEDGDAAPFYFFDDLGIGGVDEFADAGESLAAPVGEVCDAFVYEFGSSCG